MRFGSCCLVQLLAPLPTVHAFGVLHSNQRPLLTTISTPHFSARLSTTRTFMSEPTKEEESEGETTETAATSEESSTEEAPAEEQEEDPELVALKKEIADLEATLKGKRKQLDYAVEKADQYSQAGYARKVAEMENMRRTRSMLNSSDKTSAMASILAEFLPVLGRLDDLRATHGQDEFGKQYNALPGSLRSAYIELGVQDYEVQPGDMYDASRMNAVEKVHSDDFAVDTVIQPLTTGLELKGYAVRTVECVVSLGPEKVEEEAEETAPAQDEAAQAQDEAAPQTSED